MSITSFDKLLVHVTLSLGVLKEQAGATTDPVKKPFSFNYVHILNTLLGSSLKIIGKIG